VLSAPVQPVPPLPYLVNIEVRPVFVETPDTVGEVTPVQTGAADAAAGASAAAPRPARTATPTRRRSELVK
jgi:hypothetical protein